VILLTIPPVKCRWDVPLPHAMKSVYSSSNGEGTDPCFVKLKPVFRCPTLKCGGYRGNIVDIFYALYIYMKYYWNLRRL